MLVLFFLVFTVSSLNIPDCLQNFNVMTSDNDHWVTPVGAGVVYPQYNRNLPAIVVKPKSTQEVSEIMKCVYSNNICTSIKGGGHCITGCSQSIQNGVQINMDLMKSVGSLNVGPDETTITVSAGALFQDVLGFLNKSTTRYILSGGYCPTVGIAGFSSGGGIGPFTREFGVGVDNVRKITLVTVKGEIMNLDKTDTTGLFWALLGGGQRNFGVITEYVIQVHPISPTRKFTYGELCPKNDRTKLEKTYQDIIENLTVFAKNIDLIPEWFSVSYKLTKSTNQETYGLCYLLYSSNDINSTKNAAVEIFGDQILNYIELTVKDLPYLSQEHPGTFLVEFTNQVDLENANAQLKAYSNYYADPLVVSNCVIKELNAVNIKVIVDYWKDHIPEPENSTGFSCSLQGMPMSTKRSQTQEYSFPWRDYQYPAEADCVYFDDKQKSKTIAFVDGFVDNMKQVGECSGGYINFPLQSNFDGPFYYGSNYEKLKSIKNIYNSGNGILSYPNEIEVTYASKCGQIGSSKTHIPDEF